MLSEPELQPVGQDPNAEEGLREGVGRNPGPTGPVTGERVARLELNAPLAHGRTRFREIRAVGDEGFAPTDVVVHPTTGDLYVSIGGRGTRGAVYRVRYVENLRNGSQEGLGLAPLAIPAGVIDRATALVLDLPRLAESPRAGERLRALDGLLRHREAFAGHADPKTTRAYIQLARDDLRNAMIAAEQRRRQPPQEPPPAPASASQTVAKGSESLTDVPNGRASHLRVVK